MKLASLLLGLILALLATSVAQAEVSCTSTVTASAEEEVKVINDATRTLKDKDTWQTSLTALENQQAPSLTNECLQARLLVRLGRVSESEIGAACLDEKICDRVVGEEVKRARTAAAGGTPAVVTPNPDETPPTDDRTTDDTTTDDPTTDDPTADDPTTGQTIIGETKKPKLFGLSAALLYAPIAPSGAALRAGLSFRVDAPAYLELGGIWAPRSFGGYASFFFGAQVGDGHLGIDGGLDLLAPNSEEDALLGESSSASLGLRAGLALLYPVADELALALGVAGEFYAIRPDPYAHGLFLMSAGFRWGLI